MRLRESGWGAPPWWARWVLTLVAGVGLVSAAYATDLSLPPPPVTGDVTWPAAFLASVYLLTHKGIPIHLQLPPKE